MATRLDRCRDAMAKQRPSSTTALGSEAPDSRDGRALKLPGLFANRQGVGAVPVARGDARKPPDIVTGLFPDGETWIDDGPQRPVNGYLFSGKYQDPETGFYDFGQRFYDPSTSLS